jgi:hypothetical protein
MTLSSTRLTGHPPPLIHHDGHAQANGLKHQVKPMCQPPVGVGHDTGTQTVSCRHAFGFQPCPGVLLGDRGTPACLGPGLVTVSSPGHAQALARTCLEPAACTALSSTAHVWPGPAANRPAAKDLPRTRCENFLYVFKAARQAARAAATARSPSLPLTLPLRRRQRRSAGAKAEVGPIFTYRQLPGIGNRGGVHAPAAGLSEVGRNPSRAPRASASPIFDS